MLIECAAYILYIGLAESQGMQLPTDFVLSDKVTLIKRVWSGDFSQASLAR